MFVFLFIKVSAQMSSVIIYVNSRFFGESVSIRNINRRFHRSDVLRGMVHYVTKLVSDYDVYIIYSRIGFDGNLVISI